MLIIFKLIRVIDSTVESLRNSILIFKLKLKYPSLTINGRTIIEKNCQIVSEDGGKLILLNSYISAGASIRAAKGSIITIKNAFIGRNCVITSIESITIDDNCEIAEMVVIRDQNHNHDLSETRIASQGFTSSPIKIGKNVWIGCKSTILLGVEIGSNSVVGAHSLVNNNIPESSIAIGVPAKCIEKNG